VRPNEEGAARPASIPYAAIVAVPALLSYCLFRVLRVALDQVKRRYSARHPASSRQWQILSREFVEKPLVLPLIMTGAPRWNPHAVIGTLGPFFVKDTISLDAKDARGSGDWFFAVYGHPRREAAGSSSHLNDAGADWIELKVPKAGHYIIGARYYRPRPSVKFPAARLDGVETAAASITTPDVNQFYAELWKRENALYRAMAFYVLILLRCRHRVPERWVVRELIPVGNPETRFVFGVCRRGERLLWRIDRGILDSHDIFLTFYSRGSFPLLWFEIDDVEPTDARVAPSDGFFLARIQPKRSCASSAVGELPEEPLSIEIASSAA
jgi:hypothetical protein